MSYSSCIHGGACTGCMECQDREEEIFVCADCGKEIDDDVYEVDGEKLCVYCLCDRYRFSA